MTNRIRVYVPLTTREYADAWGISTAAARRRIQRMPGAVKVGSRWKAPVLASEYASRSGKSAKSIRARKRSLRAAAPEDLADLIRGRRTTKAQRDKAQRLWEPVVRRYAKNKRRISPYTIHERLLHATPEQLRMIEETDWSATEWENILDAKWEDSNEDSILFYHP